ncbi:MAG: peptidase C39 [Phenylobacterium sp.]|uniref:C39 family peptidase n=1 Tax=Phenylobacterium sp. TaxID=1871053 RepID=UPI0025E5F162|nr:C39 family peptidase [Phenylobacterium sp.]MBA4014354.1 peptidase C39 [Phenylobacterium sp.]
MPVRSRQVLFAAIAGICAFAGPAAAQIAFTDGGALFALDRVTTLRDMPFRTVVRQQYDYSCGSAALATLLRYHYGVDVAEADIFKAMYAEGDRAQIQKVGFSLLDMKRYLAARGYKADGYRIDADALVHAKWPSIAVITVGTYKHFVVVKGGGGGRILVGDPALGLKSYRQADFEKVWNGIVFGIHTGPARGIYNADYEWAAATTSLFGQPLTDDSLAALTLHLPPLYQVIWENRPPAGF